MSFVFEIIRTKGDPKHLSLFIYTLGMFLILGGVIKQVLDRINCGSTVTEDLLAFDCVKWHKL